MARVDIFLKKKYYTDTHDVDEDLRAILVCGGEWSFITSAGVALRDLSDSPTETYVTVASSDISKLIIYYTDWYDVDEDMRTISLQGGMWTEGTGTMTGVTRRGIDVNATTTFEYVASVQKK